MELQTGQASPFTLPLDPSVVTLASPQLTHVIQENEALRQEIDSLRQKVTELSSLVELAMVDWLTGLPNRRYFDQRINEEIARGRRHPDQIFSMLLIDVNDFKKVNDTFGHAAGDDLLKWIAGFLERSLRDDDVCCRMAGDEFIVILPNTDQQQAHQLVERLRQLLASVNQDLEVPLGLSIGAATFSDDGNSVEDLFKVADAAMYTDKRAQKGLPELPLESLAPPDDHLELVRPTKVYAAFSRMESP